MFKGIPYGAGTAGEGRFLPCKGPEPWSDIREAREYGPMAFQLAQSSRRYARVLDGLYPRLLNIEHWPDHLSEECLFLNVWSPGLGRGDNRPVMVWLHPGSFAGWAGNSEWTEGQHLARHHDVVVVSLNHRLNVFGHLYLGHRDARYAESGNVGVLDIVAGLRWVQENIEQFGGDARRVTIFGQSGGAGKVCALLAMPAARGLFHRAIAQSNSWGRFSSRDEAIQASDQIIARLGIKRNVLGALSSVSPQALLASPGEVRLYPVATAEAMPHQPYELEAQRLSAEIPLLVGTTRDEGTYLLLSDQPPQLNDAVSVRNALAAGLWRNGLDEEQAQRSIEVYKNLCPGCSWREIFIRIASAVFHEDAVIQAERKYELRRAPVFMYLFAWASRAFDGQYGSMHTFDVPFVFDNINAAQQLFTPSAGPRRSQLASVVSAAWAAFAHFGDPSHAALPRWLLYTRSERATMTFNNDWHLVRDPVHDERKAFESLRAARMSKLKTWRPN